MYSTDIDLGAEMLADLKQIRETIGKQNIEFKEIIEMSNVAASKAEEDRSAEKENEPEEGVVFYYKFNTLNALVQILESIAFLWKTEEYINALEPKQLDALNEYNEHLLAIIIQLTGALDSLEQLDVCLKEEMKTDKKKKLFKFML